MLPKDAGKECEKQRERLIEMQRLCETKRHELMDQENSMRAKQSELENSIIRTRQKEVCDIVASCFLDKFEQRNFPLVQRKLSFTPLILQHS